MVDYIKDGNFLKVLNNSYESFGVNEGQYLFVAGTQMAPYDEDNPYLFQALFMAYPVVDEHVVMDSKPLLISHNNVEKVGEATQKALSEILNEDLEAMKEDETTD